MIEYLAARGWLVRVHHSNAYSSGWPDLFASHPKYGQRWIEIKNPAEFSMTPAQVYWFPRYEAAGMSIYILGAATDSEYNKLFGPANWKMYYAQVLHKIPKSRYIPDPDVFGG